MSSVLILNAGYEPLQRVSIQHAIKMLVRQVAVIEEAAEEMFGSFPKPLVLRLVKYIQIKWRSHTPRWSREKLFKRDSFLCGYCGKKASTVDHILPLSRGGKTTWLNTVAACHKCNSKKGSKTLNESGMQLIASVHEPHWNDMV